MITYELKKPIKTAEGTISKLNIDDNVEAKTLIEIPELTQTDNPTHIQMEALIKLVSRQSGVPLDKIMRINVGSDLTPLLELAGGLLAEELGKPDTE